MLTPFHVFWDPEFGSLHGYRKETGPVYLLLRDVLRGLGGVTPEKAFQCAKEEIFPSTDFFDKDYGWLITFAGAFKIWMLRRDKDKRPYIDWVQKKALEVETTEKIPYMDREYDVPEWTLFWIDSVALLTFAGAICVAGVGLVESLLKFIP